MEPNLATFQNQNTDTCDKTNAANPSIHTCGVDFQYKKTKPYKYTGKINRQTRSTGFAMSI